MCPLFLKHSKIRCLVKVTDEVIVEHHSLDMGQHLNALINSMSIESSTLSARAIAVDVPGQVPVMLSVSVPLFS